MGRKDQLKRANKKRKQEEEGPEAKVARIVELHKKAQGQCAVHRAMFDHIKSTEFSIKYNDELKDKEVWKELQSAADFKLDDLSEKLEELKEKIREHQEFLAGVAIDKMKKINDMWDKKDPPTGGMGGNAIGHTG